MRLVRAATLIGAGQHAERAEMMLADPSGMKAHLLGVHSLGEDVGDEGVGLPLIVLVVVVTQREVTEFHWPLPARIETCASQRAGAGAWPYGYCIALYQPQSKIASAMARGRICGEISPMD
jgi:hypothetical protein